MDEIINIETNLYDEVTYVFGADVQISRNSLTGEVSIGWARIGSQVSDTWRALHADQSEDEEF